MESNNFFDSFHDFLHSSFIQRMKSGNGSYYGSYEYEFPLSNKNISVFYSSEEIIIKVEIPSRVRTYKIIHDYDTDTDESTYTYFIDDKESSEKVMQMFFDKEFKPFATKAVNRQDVLDVLFFRALNKFFEDFSFDTNTGMVSFKNQTSKNVAPSLHGFLSLYKGAKLHSYLTENDITKKDINNDSYKNLTNDSSTLNINDFEQIANILKKTSVDKFKKYFFNQNNDEIEAYLLPLDNNLCDLIVEYSNSINDADGSNNEYINDEYHEKINNYLFTKDSFIQKLSKKVKNIL